MDHFFEESTANVFACLMAVDVLLAELNVLGCPAVQTVQSVGKEESALLQDSTTNVKYDKVVLRMRLLKAYICNLQISVEKSPDRHRVTSKECALLALSSNSMMHFTLKSTNV